MVNFDNKTNCYLLGGSEYDADGNSTKTNATTMYKYTNNLVRTTSSSATYKMSYGGKIRLCDKSVCIGYVTASSWNDISNTIAVMTDSGVFSIVESNLDTVTRYSGIAEPTLDGEYFHFGLGDRYNIYTMKSSAEGVFDTYNKDLIRLEPNITIFEANTITTSGRPLYWEDMASMCTPDNTMLIFGGCLTYGMSPFFINGFGKSSRKISYQKD